MQRGKMAKGQAGKRRRQGVTTSLNLSFTRGCVLNKWWGGAASTVCSHEGVGYEQEDVCLRERASNEVDRGKRDNERETGRGRDRPGE